MPTTDVFELLDSLAQPTDYERGVQRPEAIKLVRHWLPMVVTARLENRELAGGNAVTLRRVAVLRKKYKIKDEEIYGD